MSKRSIHIVGGCSGPLVTPGYRIRLPGALLIDDGIHSNSRVPEREERLRIAFLREASGP